MALGRKQSILVRRQFGTSSSSLATTAVAVPLLATNCYWGALMGSLGWEQCYWCWRWKYNMYIVDHICEPLCGDCLDLYIDILGPPWQPDARAQLRILLQWEAALPANVAALVSQFAHEYWEA